MYYFFGDSKTKNTERIKHYNYGEYIKEFTINNLDNKKYFLIENNKNLLKQKSILWENIIKKIKHIKVEELFELINPFNNRNKDNITFLHSDP